MMQAGGEAKWKCAFLKGPLSSCLGLTFSLYLFFQVYTIWPSCSWWADVSIWGVMTLGGATHLQMIGPPSYNLNSYKSLLTGGPHFLQRWFGFFCARLWEELISHFMPILIFIVSKLWAKPFLKISLPHLLLYGNGLPFVENHWGNVCITLHTHTQKKFKSSTPWKQQRALFSSLSLILLIIPKAHY